MPTITNSEAGRALGAIRTPEKAAASRKNLAKARAKIKAALDAYKTARPVETKTPSNTPTLLITGKGQ
jgi:hypothetical protein